MSLAGHNDQDMRFNLLRPRNTLFGIAFKVEEWDRKACSKRSTDRDSQPSQPRKFWGILRELAFVEVPGQFPLKQNESAKVGTFKLTCHFYGVYISGAVQYGPLPEANFPEADEVPKVQRKQLGNCRQCPPLDRAVH